MSDTEKVFTVTGMDCANCAMSIERGVAGLPKVDQCALTYGTAKLRVSGAASEQDVIARVRQLGYDAMLDDGSAPAQAPSAQTKTGVMGFFAYLLQRQNTTLALLGLALIIPGLIVGEVLPLFGVTVSSAPVKILSLAALAVAGWPVARGAWRTLRVNHEISINLLMTIAAVGAVAIGAFEEAGLVMVLFALGEALEGYTAERSRNAIRSLMEVAPRQAVVLRECVDCKEHLGQNGYTGGPCPFCGVEEQLVSVDDLRVGERMIVNPGEKIAMDGRLLKGETQVSQAAITGESMPVPKRAGEDVYAGSINGDGAIEV
ncbi:MAG: cation transporter, partial [Anaerolineae bacterium]